MMKYVLLIGDGMSDRPLRELGGRTPLAAANIPNMDRISSGGILGLMNNHSRRFGMNSDVCILNILGYDPSSFYTGRGPLEAASMGIEPGPGRIAFRCNLVTVDDERLLDFSAGHISNQEAAVLIKELNRRFICEGMNFHAGVSYRNIVLVDSNNPRFKGINMADIRCLPPHDAVNMKLSKAFPSGKGGELLKEIMLESKKLLLCHEVNQVRNQLNENPANMAWLWGQGFPPALPAFPLKGSVISAVDVVKGIAVRAGLKPVNVPGATGYYDTDYGAKAEYAVKALRTDDFVLVHVESPDEAGHEGNIGEKISAIENFDEKIVGPLLDHLEKTGEFRIAVLPDHATPVSVRNHAPDPIPFAVRGTGVKENSGLPFDEKSAKSTGLFMKKGHEFMDFFLA